MRLLYLILLLLCGGLIFYLSGIPNFSTGTQGFLARKLGHSFLYGIFTYLLWKSIPKLETKMVVKFIFCLLILLAVAISDEFRQAFVPGRHGNYRGVLFDLLGGCAVLSFFLIRTHKRRTEPHLYEK